MTRRALTALLLSLGLLLVPACSSGDQSGDSNPDSQVDEEPGSEDRTSESDDDD